MVSGETKVFICMIHGHELRCGNDSGREDTGQRGIKGRNKWDNCNSIIHKIYFSFYKDFNYLFLERGREGEREVEKH